MKLFHVKVLNGHRTIVTREVGLYEGKPAVLEDGKNLIVFTNRKELVKYLDKHPISSL